MRVDERSGALGDQLEDAVEIGLAAERVADVDRRFETADRALELTAPLTLLRVGARVVDRDRCPVGKYADGLLVLLGELTVDGLSVR